MCLHRQRKTDYSNEMRERFSEFLKHWMVMMRFDIDQAADYIGVSTETINSVLDCSYKDTLDDFVRFLDRCGYHLDFKFLHN